MHWGKLSFEELEFIVALEGRRNCTYRIQASWKSSFESHSINNARNIHGQKRILSTPIHFRITKIRLIQNFQINSCPWLTYKFKRRKEKIIKCNINCLKSVFRIKVKVLICRTLNRVVEQSPNIIERWVKEFSRRQLEINAISSRSSRTHVENESRLVRSTLVGLAIQKIWSLWGDVQKWKSEDSKLLSESWVVDGWNFAERWSHNQSPHLKFREYKQI